jgi:phosphoesterase RecJ-like protein
MDEIIQFIRDNDHFLITTHVNADGDAYASSVAVALLLKHLGKNYTLLFPDAFKENRYSFLPLYDQIQTYEESKQYPKFSAAIICDAPGEGRIPGVSDLLPPREFRLKIDHHPAENSMAKYNFEDTNASSASRLVYELAIQFEGALNQEMATAIYAGISYDTGRFSFSNTSKRDYEIASHLMDFDIKIHEINEHMFFTYHPDALRVIGYGLANLRLMENGQICLIPIPLKQIEKVKPGDIDELAHYSVSMDGVRVGAFIREIKPDFYKISLRARDDTPVNAVAAEFGGGGHRKAAGCRLSGTYDEVVRKLIEAIKKHWK